MTVLEYGDPYEKAKRETAKETAGFEQRQGK